MQPASIRFKLEAPRKGAHLLYPGAVNLTNKIFFIKKNDYTKMFVDN